MKIYRIIIIILFATTGFAQISSSKWSDHLSYLETTDISIWNDKIITASEYGVFIYDNDDNSLTKFSKINGLIGDRITAIASLVNVNAFIVGYETGKFSIIYSDGRILHVTDIANSSVSGEKNINSIIESDEKIYIATTFGVVEYNVNREEFGDTFYFGPDGSYIQSNDMAIKNDTLLFVATSVGVYKANLNNPFLVDYKQWELQEIGTIPSSEFNTISQINNLVVANNSQNDNKQYVLRGNQWVLGSEYKYVNKIKATSDNMMYSAGNNVYIFNNDIVLEQTISKGGLGARSSMKKNGELWVATSSDGMANYNSNNEWNYIAPSGPKNNFGFRIKAGAKKLYVVYGYFNSSYTPKGRLMGYDVFDTKDWLYVEPKSFSNVKDLVDVAIDPLDSDHIYICSWRAGVLELQDNERVDLWVEENTENHIQKLFYAPDPNYVSIRIGGSVFDSDGNLWVANGWNVDRPFVVRKPTGEWNSFTFDNAGAINDNGMAGITIDNNGNKWIATRSDGIWIYNEGESLDSTGDDLNLKFSTAESKGGLPDLRVNTVAIDKDNIAWIGTKLGLVVFSDIENMFEVDYYKAEPIIIEVDGEGKKLLGNQTINKIVVDGANNKWFATESGGVYYTSSNGQKTIHHFTSDNSPLLSNNVLDLDIDPETGRVFFMTDKGLFSYLGNATEGGTNFSKVFAYPNPVRPEYDGDIYIKGLTDKTNVKITDVNGNLIFETTSEGGQAVWNRRSLSGYRASSGVYIVFAVSKDGTDTTITKILIVN